jgi:hypothetical protein
MRSALFVACILLLVFSSSPANAQLRQDAAKIDAPVRLYDAGGTGISLSRFFSPEVFRMSHGFELSSSSSFGGYGGGTMAMYTNSMMWQFSSKLAARVDVAMAYSPTGGSTTGSLSPQGLNGQNGKVFLRNAEIAYRPSENTLFQFSVRQSPYGRYMSPYGYNGGLGGGYGNNAFYGGFRGASGSADRLFWNDHDR